MTNTIINNNIFENYNKEFRSFDGSGNNLNNLDYGMAGNPLLDKVPLEYGDGYSSPAGEDRANPRTISNTIAKQTEDTPSDRGLTNLIWAFGQFAYS